MARPCFPFPSPKYCRPATALEAANQLGDGKVRPVGLTLSQLVELFLRVQLWQVSFNVSSVTTFIENGYEETFSASGSLPAITGLVGYGFSGSAGIEDLWGGTKESGGALYGGFSVTVGVNETDILGGFNSVSGDSVNYTASELNALSGVSSYDNIFEQDTTSSLGVAALAGIGDWVLCSGGLYYPSMGFYANGEGTLITSTPSNANANTCGSATINLLSGAISFPIFIDGVDDAERSYSGSASFTVSPIKYWPYKDAAGVALYDEDTGERV